MVTDQNDLRKKMYNKKLSRWLYKTYPRMPSKDMARLHDHFLSSFAKRSKITDYVLLMYPEFASPRSGDEKHSMARQEADEIVPTWHGE